MGVAAPQPSVDAAPAASSAPAPRAAPGDVEARIRSLMLRVYAGNATNAEMEQLAALCLQHAVRECSHVLEQ